MMDYRQALRAKGLRPLTPALRAKLRTNKQPGDVEVTRSGLLRHDATGAARAA